ncbi:Uncharacterised protein [Xylophilus ampelinus]|nr:Uncharacterised protein [Xylophilus ampelinus]
MKTLARARTICATLFSAAVLFSPASAEPRLRTWAPFGYTTNHYNGEIRGVLDPTFSSTPAETCTKVNLWPLGYAPGPWCELGSWKPGFCSPWTDVCTPLADNTGQPGFSWADLGTVFPVCRKWPPSEPESRKGIIGRVGPDATGSVCRCESFALEGPIGKPLADAIPDLDTGYCYKPLQLELQASRSRFVARERDKPLTLDAWVQRVTAPSQVANEPVKFSVSSSGSAPGSVTPLEGITDPEGHFLANYRFPKFTGPQVDTITATCERCGEPATVTIKMAPLVFGFFNGVWNTKKQATDGLGELRSLTGDTYRDIPIRYEQFYNQTGSGNGNTALQDLAEVFIQRGKELDGVLANRW